MMNVLHINTYYLHSKFYKNMYDHQQKNGFNISVFVSSNQKSENLNFNYGDYTTISHNHNKRDRLIFHLKHLKILKKVQQNYEVGNFNIIHAHSLFSNGYIAYKLKMKYKIPYIVAVRNTDINTFFKKMFHLRGLGVKILENSEKIIFISKPYQDILYNDFIPAEKVELLKKKSVIIPNGIDNFWFENLNNPQTLNKEMPVKLLYVGEVNKNKNLIATTEAITELREAGYNLTYTIVGKISDKDVFLELSSKPFMKYLPPVSKEELLNIYRDHSIFIMPSHRETFGLVYAEAMTQGLPVIYSQKQGFDENFKEGIVGYSVNPRDIEQLKEKIIQVIQNYEILSSNTVELANKFQWDKINKEYTKIYFETI